LNIYLNGYASVPPFLLNPKITVEWSQTCPFGDRGDAGKFYWAEMVAAGYHVIIDDDIIYPPDFVETLVTWCQRYQNKAIVGTHGVVLTEPFTGYYESRRVYPYAKTLENAVSVHLVGTGGVCYHTGALRVCREEFKHPNMADIWLALLAQEQRVPTVCIPHKAGWLRDIPGTGRDSIFHHSLKRIRSAKNTADKQTEVIQATWPWQIFPVQT